MIPKQFSLALLRWYDKNKRDLPWRHTKNPYHIWVSEMMLQQTTVSTVIGHYDHWLKRFPTLQSLADASLQDVLKAWQGLGYYNRARNFHKAANIVIKDFKGILPKDPLKIRELPGFGPYATASVLSIAYDLPLTLVDANVRRVMMRLACINGEALPKVDPTLHELLKPLMPKRAGDFNQALMELGALICKSKEPLCAHCPVKQFCQAYKNDEQGNIPTLRKKMIEEVNAAIGIIMKGNQYFIQQRDSAGLLADLWEFPGGKIESGESPQQAVKRELFEEVGVTVTSTKFLAGVTHFYTQYKVKLSVWLCIVKDFPKPNKRQRWVKLDDLDKYPMPSGSAKIIPYLLAIQALKKTND